MKDMKKIILIALVLILQFSCTEEEIKSRPYPRVRTSSATDFEGNKATFHGEITFITEAPITDHGFIWSTSNTLSIGNAEKKSLGHKDSTGKFESEVTYSFALGISYYIRAYATSGEYTVYGDLIEFIP